MAERGPMAALLSVAARRGRRARWRLGKAFAILAGARYPARRLRARAVLYRGLWPLAN